MINKMETNKHLDITLDLETASLSSHAAIMQIAAVAWDRFADDAGHMFLTSPECAFAREAGDTKHFCVNVDLNSQFVEGLWDFSQTTAEWWRRQSDAAKQAVVGHADITKGDWMQNTSQSWKDPEKMALNYALLALDEWITSLMDRRDSDSVCVWCQGTDFDIPILRYAAEMCGLDSKCKPVALRHEHICDCRTAIYTNVAAWLGRQSGDTPRPPYSQLDLLNDPLLAYMILPDLPASFGSRENAHGALYDCIRSTWFTWQALHLMR